MALPILDGNQSATTLSTIIDGGAHIPAHTVVSLGSQAITDITSAVSGVTIAGAVTANLASAVTINSSGASFSNRVVSKSELKFEAVAGAIDTSKFSDTYTLYPLKITAEAEGRNLSADLRTTSQGNDLSAIATDATAAFVRTQVVGGSVTIGSLPAISGTVTANLSAQFLNETTGDYGLRSAVAYDDDGDLREVSKDFPLPIANPNGALTTHFGSVTTAGVAEITSAVTSLSRKYLLIQNIASSTVTIGIGFAPTTTQGIQLSAGGGLTFDAFCPTGAVYWLSSVTGSNWSILEG